MNCGATVIIPNVLSFLLTTVEVVEPSEDENSEDEDSDEGVFPFLHPMFGGMGMFFHHMLYAHAGVDSSEGSSSEED